MERTGALLVAWTPEQLAALPGIEAKAGTTGTRPSGRCGPVSSTQREPALGPGAAGALEIPDESIICPWTTPLAFATEAVGGGCQAPAVRAGHRGMIGRWPARAGDDARSAAVPGG